MEWIYKFRLNYENHNFLLGKILIDKKIKSVLDSKSDCERIKFINHDRETLSFRFEIQNKKIKNFSKLLNKLFANNNKNKKLIVIRTS